MGKRRGSLLKKAPPNPRENFYKGDHIHMIWRRSARPIMVSGKGIKWAFCMLYPQIVSKQRKGAKYGKMG